LACELAGYFYLEVGDSDKAMEYFLLAHEKYHEWGAFGKCDSLFKCVERIFTPASTGAGVGITHTTDSNTLMKECEDVQWNQFLLERKRNRDT
jgi:hypothetical protein